MWGKKLETTEVILDHNKLSPEMEEIRANLDMYVIGQEEAKNQVIDALSRTLTPVPRNKPIATFFFVWPTWVGKTELAKWLGKILFWSDNYDIKWTKIDCNTFLESHAISELVWSPAGYIWSESNTPKLSDISLFRDFNKAKEENRLHPLIKNLDNFAILLIDEVEKAHPDLHDLLLNIFEDWNLSLRWWKEDNSKISHSKYTDFRNVLIIMTSNIGAKEVQNMLSWKSGKMWFITNDSENIIPRSFYEEEMKKAFRPEFLWRITEFIPFTSLTEEQYDERVDMETFRFNKKLNWIISFRLSENVKKQLVKKSMIAETWARALVNEFQKNIETIISRLTSNWEISRIENESKKMLSYIEIDLWEKWEYVVKAKFDENKLEERFSRRVIKSQTELTSDEVIVSLHSWSFLNTMKEIIIPNIEYLKILYAEKDNFSENFESEIVNTEKKLLAWWLTQKDLTLISNEVYRKQYEDLRDLFTSLDWIQIWSKEENQDKTTRQKIVKKITERFIVNNIYMIVWWAWNLEEITSDLKNILEKNFRRKLDKNEENIMIIVIHREYIKSNISYVVEKKEISKTTQETNKGKNLDETSKIDIVPKKEADKWWLTINLTLNFYWDADIPKEEKIRKFKEKWLNLFWDKLEEIMLAVKQSCENKENDLDLILILENVKENLEKLSSNQEQYLNELIQEYLKNNKID